MKFTMRDLRAAYLAGVNEAKDSVEIDYVPGCGALPAFPADEKFERAAEAYAGLKLRSIGEASK